MTSKQLNIDDIVIDSTSYDKEKSGELSTFYITKLKGRRIEYLLKIANFDSTVNSYNLRGIISNQIAVLNYLEEQNALPKLGIGYVGYTRINSRIAVVFEKFEGTTLEIRCPTNMADLAADKNAGPKDVQLRDEDSPLPLEEAVQIYTQALHRLKVYHDHGLIHFDIKPDNIILTGGSVRIIDEALARRKNEHPKSLFNGKIPNTQSSSYYSSINEIFRSRFFHPPELGSKSKVEVTKAQETIDIYNITDVLCLYTTGRTIEYYKEVLWEKVKNIVPAEGTPALDVSLFLRRTLYQRIREKNPTGISDERINQLVTIILKGTEEDVNERYKTVAEIFADLNKVKDSSLFTSVTGEITGPPATPALESMVVATPEYHQPTASPRTGPPSPPPPRRSAASQPPATASAPSQPPAAEPAVTYTPSVAPATAVSASPAVPPTPVASSPSLPPIEGITTPPPAVAASSPSSSSEPLRTDFLPAFANLVRTGWDRWKKSTPKSPIPADSSATPVVEAAKAVSSAYMPAATATLREPAVAFPAAPPSAEINLMPEVYAPRRSRAPWKTSTWIALAAGGAITLGALGLGSYATWRRHQDLPTITILRPAAADNSSLEAALQGYSPQIQEQAQKVEQSLGPDGKKILVDLLQQRNYQGPEALSIAGELAEIALKKDSRQFIERANQYKSGNNLK